MVSLWCVLALFTFLFLETSGTNPGVRIRITQKGLEYQRQISISPLVEKLKSIHIPNRSGSGHILFMDIYYAVKNMHIQNVHVPFSSVRLVPGTGVILSISDVYIGMTGNWEVSYLFVDNGGWFELAIRGITISTTIGIHKDGSGRPMVSTASCRASVGQVYVTLHGVSSWLYELFDGFIDSILRNALQSQICPEVTQALNNMNSHLHTLSVLAQVDEYAEVEYSMVESPLVSYSAVDLALKGMFYNIGNHTEPPFSPTPFSRPHQDNKMLYMALSAFTLNSASFVYNNARVLSQYITDNMIPSGSSFRLDTKTFGTLIPQIAKQYPGLKMKLLVKAVEEPHFSFETNNVTMQGSSTVTAYAVQPNAPLTPLFVLNLNASMSARIYIKDLKVAGNVTLNKIDMTLRTSNVGPFQVELLDNAFKTVLNVALIPEVNAFLQEGYPLPVIGRINLLNTQLQILKDYVLIGTDVQLMGVNLFGIL